MSRASVLIQKVFLIKNVRTILKLPDTYRESMFFMLKLYLNPVLQDINFYFHPWLFHVVHVSPTAVINTGFPLFWCISAFIHHQLLLCHISLTKQSRHFKSHTIFIGIFLDYDINKSGEN